MLSKKQKLFKHEPAGHCALHNMPPNVFALIVVLGKIGGWPALRCVSRAMHALCARAEREERVWERLHRETFPVVRGLFIFGNPRACDPWSVQFVTLVKSLAQTRAHCTSNFGLTTRLKVREGPVYMRRQRTSRDSVPNRACELRQGAWHEIICAGPQGQWAAAWSVGECLETECCTASQFVEARTCVHRPDEYSVQLYFATGKYAAEKDNGTFTKLAQPRAFENANHRIGIRTIVDFSDASLPVFSKARVKHYAQSWERREKMVVPFVWSFYGKLLPDACGPLQPAPATCSCFGTDSDSEQSTSYDLCTYVVRYTVQMQCNLLTEQFFRVFFSQNTQHPSFQGLLA